MVLKRVLLLAMMVLASEAWSQEHWVRGSLYSTAAYYVDDDKTGDFQDDDRFRSNSYLKLDAGLGGFSAGFQLEMYTPQALLNFNPNYNKDVSLGTYYLSYKKDGFDVILDLKIKHPDLKVIAISGGGRLDSRTYLEIAKGIGADFYLDKPFKLDKLLEAVHEILK